MALSLKGKTAFITGASRGIGLEIGKALAARGANVAVAAKTADPNPRLPGTIYSAVEEIDAIGEKTGARGLALQLDIRQAEAVQEAIEKTAERFGGLDIVVNNASAINMTKTQDQTPKAYDLMSSINARGTWLSSRYALPHLLDSAKKGRNPHVLTLSPPLEYGLFSDAASPLFAQTGSAYAVAKVGMSLATFALAAETRGLVGCNGLWPFTLIGTSAMKLVSQDADGERTWRSPEFVAEAARRIFEEDGKEFTGRFLLDEVYLRRHHRWTHDQVAAYSLGGKDVPLDSLAEDLYITQEMREDVLRARN